MEEHGASLCSAIASLSAAIIIKVLLKKKKSKQKRIWVKPWIQRRRGNGIQDNLLKELQVEDKHSYKRFLRINDSTFNYIVMKVTPYIERQNTYFRDAISVNDRVMVTLRFLATGESFTSLQFLTRIPQCTISTIVPETCEAIYMSMKDEYLKTPKTQSEWENISREFEEKCNFNNCIGAMDGKHVKMYCPANGGSHYFNYKLYHSIILFALVDANYKFLYVDAGTNGRIGDAGVFAKSTLRSCLLDRSKLNIPEGKCLPGTNINQPYVVLADDAFPLSYNIMKPYPLTGISREERIFNYRLSRARRMVECAFGILVNRFRVFTTAINLSPDKVTKLIMAACTMHNLLTEKMEHNYTGRSSSDTEEPIDIGMQIGRENRRHGAEVREIFKNYYNGLGGVPWQENYI